MKSSNNLPLQVSRNLVLLAAMFGTASAISAEPAARIVGGTPAANNAYPFMVGLIDASSNNVANAQFCGGSLIAPNWVLTAAHCVENTSAGEIDALINTNKLDGSGQRIRAKRVIVHQNYATTGKSDVALIQLTSNANAAAISLLQPGTGLEKAGQISTVIGWGLTQDGGSPSRTLMQVDVPVVSDAVCVTAYSGGVDATTEMCAGLPQGQKDSCNGDSGGPLFVKDSNGSVFQAGVVSWGEGCAVAGKYGVYARVSSHFEWINNAMNGDGTEPPTGGGTTPPPPPSGGGDQTTDFSFECVELTCSFSANAIANVDEYIWEFGENDEWAVGQNVSHSYAAAGSYEVYLGVFTSDGDYSEVIKMVNVEGDSENQGGFALNGLLEEGESYASGSGILNFGDTLVLEMTAPQGADFDLYLERFDASRNQWVKVAAQASPDTGETISADIKQAGEYRLRVFAYRGAGEFSVSIAVQ